MIFPEGFRQGVGLGRGLRPFGEMVVGLALQLLDVVADIVHRHRLALGHGALDPDGGGVLVRHPPLPVDLRGNLFEFRRAGVVRIRHQIGARVHLGAFRLFKVLVDLGVVGVVELFPLLVGHRLAVLGAEIDIRVRARQRIVLGRLDVHFQAALAGRVLDDGIVFSREGLLVGDINVVGQPALGLCARAHAVDRLVVLEDDALGLGRHVAARHLRGRMVDFFGPRPGRAAQQPQQQAGRQPQPAVQALSVSARLHGGPTGPAPRPAGSLPGRPPATSPGNPHPSSSA